MVHGSGVPRVSQSKEDAEALPFVVQNTFISVAVRVPSVPLRRCSSLPPMRKVPPDGYDSEAVTDICTDTDDETFTFSDSGITTDGEPQDVIEENDACSSSMPQRTKLNPRAALYAPPISAPPPPPTPEAGIAITGVKPVVMMQPGAPTWKLGLPNDSHWVQAWEETVKDVVAKVCLALCRDECVSCVECSSKGAGWAIVVRSQVDDIRQFERIQTTATEALTQASTEPPCLCLMGYRRLPFQPTSMGFYASLGSVTTAQKACWDVYSNGFCPRGCNCTWEHPALVHTVNVIIERN